MNINEARMRWFRHVIGGEEEDPVLDIANERTKKNKRMMDSIIPV